jgi:hypothetical protein
VRRCDHHRGDGDEHKRLIRELLSRERLATLDKDVEIPWEMDFKRPSRARRFHLKSGVIGGHERVW